MGHWQLTTDYMGDVWHDMYEGDYSTIQGFSVLLDEPASVIVTTGLSVLELKHTDPGTGRIEIVGASQVDPGRGPDWTFNPGRATLSAETGRVDFSYVAVRARMRAWWRIEAYQWLESPPRKPKTISELISHWVLLTTADGAVKLAQEVKAPPGTHIPDAEMAALVRASAARADVAGDDLVLVKGPDGFDQSTHLSVDLDALRRIDLHGFEAD